MIRPLTILMVARGLRCGDHDYDRALVDMTSDLLAIDRDMAQDLVLGEGTLNQ